MDDLQQATRMYTSCADPTESAARKQRVLVSDAQGDMEVAPHRIINAAIATHAIQAQLLAQHMVLPPAVIPAPSEPVSNVQDQRQSTTVITGKKQGRPAKPKDKPKDMRIIPKTFVGSSSRRRILSIVQASLGTAAGSQQGRRVALEVFSCYGKML
ncbi:hypothetical protein F2Q68_00011177 [Brassica cretica]|uniref:Uncharacterized protein n=1 Tax=Brassica cretica TaxID=69181 RepID=A0A8S9KTH8_BRACR|nr:hypothetical protein F2Q68_00011177 [Brassica cretica]